VARTWDKRGNYRMLQVGAGNLRVRDQLEGIRTNWAKIEMDFQKQINRLHCLIWFRFVMKGGQLWKQKWTLGFHKVRGTFCLAEGKLAFEKDSAACNSFVLLSLVGMTAGIVRTVRDVYWGCVVWLSDGVKMVLFSKGFHSQLFDGSVSKLSFHLQPRLQHRPTYWTFS